MIVNTMQRTVKKKYCLRNLQDILLSENDKLQKNALWFDFNIKNTSIHTAQIYMYTCLYISACSFTNTYIIVKMLKG
jgi:hypothetical protein